MDKHQQALMLAVENNKTSLIKEGCYTAFFDKTYLV